jgi:hypothetical protein
MMSPELSPEGARFALILKSGGEQARSKKHCVDNRR